MPGGSKGSKDKQKPMQSKLTDFGSHVKEQIANKEATVTSNDANEADGGSDANEKTVNLTGTTLSKQDTQLLTAKDEILGEIRNMKETFSRKFDGVMEVLEETKKGISDCTERLSQAEVRLCTVEDEQNDLKSAVENLQKRNKYLEEKMIDVETRSRLNNIRVVGLPENCEDHDMCGFLENWLPEALDLNPLRDALVLERAYRIGPKRGLADPPRTVIMRFLNYKQKEIILKAAKAKKDVLFKNHRVKLFVDMATEVHRQRKKFDGAREQLRQLGVKHGILSPATLVLTYKDEVHKFSSPAEANSFVKKIRMDN